MTRLTGDEHDRGSWMRILAAVLVGLVGSAIIWVATPYSNYAVTRVSSICGSYLPVAALFLIIVLVLFINPLLRRLTPQLALDKSQLAIVLGMFLVASVLPAQGLLRQLPYSIANLPLVASRDRRVAKAYEDMKLPPSLFPGKIAYDKPPSVSEHFVDKLPEGEPMPWGAWVGPLLSWGVFLLFSWFMMIGLAQIVLPQWRDNELLAFPLLTVQQSLVEEPEQGRTFAPLFRSRPFWVAVGVVFVLHLLVGLSAYFPGRVPKIPLEWNISGLFGEGLFQYMPYYIRESKIYFIFLGVAFFMPSRIGFSIWFFQILYAGYHIFGAAYFPPFQFATITEHRTGAMFAVAAVVLWLGRRHWAHVLACMFRTAKTPEDRRDRNAGLMFLLGCVGLDIWLMWAGVSWPWAIFFVVFIFIVSLIITRIVAETGMVFVRLHFFYDITVIRLLPISWLSLPVLFFQRVIVILFAMGSRVSATTMATHAIALDKEATPKRQWRFGVLLVAVLAIGLVICGGTHVRMNYQLSASYDGEERPLNVSGLYMFTYGHGDMINFQEGKLSRPPYNQAAHLSFGAGLALVLEWLCLKTPLWPLHPVGLLMVNTYYADIAWVSVFIGWLTKILVLRYGGARLYRAARPFFMGVILGEVFAAVFWAIEPAIRVVSGLDYQVIQLQPY